MSIDFTEPLQTRDGQPVEIITTTGRGLQPVKGYIGERDTISSWHRCGGYRDASAYGDDLDLINVSEQRVRYFNIYPNGDGRGYPTSGMANRNAEDDRIACVRVEYTDGQYDA